MSALIFLLWFPIGIVFLNNHTNKISTPLPVMQIDTGLVKVIPVKFNNKYKNVADLQSCRIIETDNTIYKDVRILEIHSYWIVYEKNGSSHDFMIERIKRIEIGPERNYAIFFTDKKKPFIDYNF
jgi:hypothetical protein